MVMLGAGKRKAAVLRRILLSKLRIPKCEDISFIVQEIFHSGMNPFRFYWKSEGSACNFPFICMPCIISFERLRLRKLRRLFCCYVSSSGAVGSISEAFAGQRCKMHQI